MLGIYVLVVAVMHHVYVGLDAALTAVSVLVGGAAEQVSAQPVLQHGAVIMLTVSAETNVTAITAD